MHNCIRTIFRLACCGLLLIGTPGMGQEKKETVVAAPDSSANSVVVTEESDNETEASFDPVESFEHETNAIRPMPGHFTQKLQEDADFHYVKTGLTHKDIQEEGNPHTPARGWVAFFKVLPYIAIAVFIGLLIWYLASHNFILFRKKSTSVHTPAVTEEHQDIFSIDYAAAIRQALQQNNYRLAIRLQYLELLKKLSDRQLIHFLPDKTNFEYMLQMRSSSYYDDFFMATRHYEYSWYGLFDITENMYQKINNTFQQLKQKL
ncbi:hypothetical protein [Niabella sp.]|uniref:hypothetical protein n=1 Tax=Niabella sp. TaxID=1962976 RepID=UPI0026377255|nr:hypothetical protein [Niabella sp.]